ncbi:hypothetical protein MMC22_004605 [Lobaria immixta]|nr:hypothetical protein [Lobaria immixta]
MSAPPSLKTAHAVIAAYKAWTLPSILAFRAPHCVQQVLPATLDRPPMTNAQYADYFEPLLPLFRDFTLTVHNLVHDEPGRKVAMHVTSAAETDKGPYRNEYMLMLEMSEDGSQVEKFLEFVDSARTVSTLASTQKQFPLQERSTVAMSAPPSLKTAHAAIDAYNAWTLPSILAVRAPHCVQQVLPATLDRPPMTNAQYADYLEPLLPLFRDFTSTVHNVVHDEPGRKVAMHVTSAAETDIGPYRNEYMVILEMTEDGSQVEKFLEFVDRAHTVSFFTRLRAHHAGLAKED